MLTFLQMVNPDIPHNDGMVQPIEIVIPEGTILNASYPAATTFGNHLCPPNADAIIRALAPVIPERVTRGLEPAALLALHGLGPARQDDTYVDILFMGLKGGSGAMHGCDGYDHIGMIDASGGVLDQDYEMFEQQTPHRLVRHEYITDSAGAGEVPRRARASRRATRVGGGGHADRHLRRRRRGAGLRAATAAAAAR